MRPITTSVYTFSHLIEGGFIYVDKTAHIHRLLTPAFAQHFLARPRRFGKSLLVSTLKAIFLGQRELFRGLAIDALPFDWNPHPIIHIDLGICQADTAGELERNLCQMLGIQADVHGIALRQTSPCAQFLELATALSARGRIVILVDEYDKPLLGALGDAGRAQTLLPVMKRFYSAIKTTEPLQRFVLLTGVSKFSKVSVFSDLNNLTDLTMDGRCATLLGYTQEELETYFADRLAALTAKYGIPHAELLDHIRKWYNGYRFAEDAPTVYNPVSAMRFFDTGKFSNYWFETGTPSFLPRLLRAKDYDLSGIGKDEVSEDNFSAYDIDKLQPLPLLLQTGYLTIKSHLRHGVMTRYILDYPNDEVRESFGRHLATEYSQVDDPEVTTQLDRIVAALERGDLDAMFAALRVFFANIPHTIQLTHEKYYQSVFHILLTVVGVHLESEVATASGRIDAVVKTKDRIYIFEFKLHGTAKKALAQIRDKRYFEKYLADGRPITLVGAAFDRRTRNLGQFLAEPWR